MIGRTNRSWLAAVRSTSIARSTVVAVVAMICTASASAQLGGGWGGGQACPDVWDPVCGVNGITYSNSCYAAVAGVEIAHHGACHGGPGGPVLLGGGGFVCPDVWDPVCGVNGFTYSNACYASVAGVEVAYEGPCLGGPGGPVALSGSGQSCITLWDPVCGVNGVTYSNECFANLAGVEIAHKGPCGGGPGGPVIIGLGDLEAQKGCLCPANHYCHTPPGECDAEPVCKPRPEACLDVWIPVCGCDGQTYSNECYAAAAGVSVAFHDTCPGWPGGSEIIGGDDLSFCLCQRGHYCHTPPGQCDADPVCKERPEYCIDVWDPVCGCDGITYGNSCYAARDGMSIKHHGYCDGDGYSPIGAGVLPLPDLNGDGKVGVEDLLLVFQAMGCTDCAEDISRTGEVDVHDVLLILSAWDLAAVE